MTAIINAFGPVKKSVKAETMIGDLMKKMALKEGHKARLPNNIKPGSKA